MSRIYVFDESIEFVDVAVKVIGRERRWRWRGRR